MKTLTLSILQFNNFVKRILDAEDFLSNISVFGEVTNFKVSGGNAYFDLKDENAMLSCVKFDASTLNIKNGDLITVFGKVNFYVKSGRLNFIVSRAEAYGLGALYQNFLMLKQKLETEGLFREEIKKEIPKFSKRIGVVTSETGAVIRDIINVTRSKNPYTDIVVYPSKVQGVGAEDELVSGIEYFNSRDDIDVIIVARGGGSLEDLSPFNTEKIVRGIYRSNLPVISAVGHETDFTLCDFAADLRVPTPSVAAEVAVFDYFEQIENIDVTNKNIYYFITKKLEEDKKDLLGLESFISSNLKVKIVKAKTDIALKIKDIEKIVENKVLNSKNRLENMISMVSKLSPLEVLKRGFAVVEKSQKRVTSVKEVAVGDDVVLRLDDGKAVAEIKNISEDK
ncbi:MAG: exodeoxyribonuclease VII large subunit [Clostridiales bacterium]|nr:exodeoxyribonuclease VII large subunit [Clostridiales bacterium]